MATREVHLERLLGRCVYDASGKPVGRIEEVRAEQQGDNWVIQEYLIGAAAVLERLSAWNISMRILRLLGAPKLSGSYRVPWDQLDLADPENPRLYCSSNELDAL